MSMLSKITRGKVKRPHCIVVYGPDGVGKTTFGAEAPKPIFLGPELGTANLDVARFETPKSFMECIGAVMELTNERHDFETLVIDSLDWIEPLVHKMVCIENGNARSIELAAGGYGKGYKEALQKWVAWKDLLENLRNVRKMNLIFLAHAEIKDFNDPQNQMSYQRFQLKLHKDASAFFREYAEAVLFLNHQTHTKKEGTQVRAYGSGQRVAYTERGAGWDAKNRLDLPVELPLFRGQAWQAFAEAADRGEPDKLEAVHKRLGVLVDEVQDGVLKQKAVESIEKAGVNVAQLLAIEGRLRKVLSSLPVTVAPTNAEYVLPPLPENAAIVPSMAVRDTGVVTYVERG